MNFDFFINMFYKFANAFRNMIDFFNKNLLGQPLYYWLLGGGLLLYLAWRIIQAITPL